MTREQATGIAYDATLEALTDPGAAGDFFQRHQPRSPEAWCAEFSRLAYCDYARVLAPCLSSIGFGLIAEPFDRAGTQAFLAGGPDFAVLAFRGSDDLRAWMTNVNILPVPWRGGGRAHAGFAAALDAVRPELEAALAAVSGHLLVTGHSLGGALAALAASLRPEADLYSYGAPRVGDRDFRAAMERRRGGARRYVNHRDIVCRVPPAPLGYRHVGAPYAIDRAGNVAPGEPEDPGLGDLLSSALPLDRQSLAARFGQTLPRELTDHAPINYVSALR
jgi:hypothetical protein